MPSASVHMPGPEWFSDFAPGGPVVAGTVISARLTDVIERRTRALRLADDAIAVRVSVERVWGRWEPSAGDEELAERHGRGWLAPGGRRWFERIAAKVKGGPFEPSEEIVVERGPPADFIPRPTTSAVFGQGFLSGHRIVRDLAPGDRIVILWARGDFHAVSQTPALLQKLDLLFDPDAARRHLGAATRPALLAMLDDRDLVGVAIAGLDARGFLDGEVLSEVTRPHLLRLLEALPRALDRARLTQLLEASAAALARADPERLEHVLRSPAARAAAPRATLALLRTLDLSSKAELALLEAFLRQQSEPHGRVELVDTADQHLMGDLLVAFASRADDDTGRYLVSRALDGLDPQVRTSVQARLASTRPRR
ncbi:MAG TPA: hypothetical protein VFL83_08155 [Anaeromyxobacter sp.]|nr:hypothetical protein [Anaeromyxobacter sp.]